MSLCLCVCVCVCVCAFIFMYVHSCIHALMSKKDLKEFELIFVLACFPTLFYL